TTQQVRAGDQYQDGESARPHGAADPARPRRRGDRMRRRDFVLRLAGTAAAWPLALHAQETKKIPRLCFLTFDPGSSQSIRFKPFFEGLSELGYVDGQTIAIEFLSAEGQGDRFADLAGQCVRLNANVIVVASTPAGHAAKGATRTIPIVMIGL